MAISSQTHARRQDARSLTQPRPPRRRVGNPVIDRCSLLVVPAVVLLIVVFVYPVCTIMIRTFTEHGNTGGSLANFEWLLGSSTQMTILRRTFVTAALVAGICLAVCYPFAYLLTIASGGWRLLLVGVVVVSSWQSILVRTFAWKVILRDNGPLNDALHAVGLGRIHLLGTTAGVLIAMCQVMAPFMILPLYASMRNIDRRLLAAAQSLGATPAGAFRRVYLPLSLPGIVAGTLLVFVLSLGFYVTPAVVGSSENAMLSQAIVLEVQRALEWGHAGAMALTLLTATLLAVALGALLTRGRLRAVAGRHGG
jgi:putative spermidine/putrescine transport system permease protein